jgi:branched-chain amino acid transport system permease protein
MKMISRHKPLLILAGVLLLLPLVLPNNFYYDIAIRMAINAIIVLGLNLLIGFAGQISLGHGTRFWP